MKSVSLCTKFILYLMSTAVIVVTIIEGVGFITSNDKYFWANRFLFISEGSIRVLGNQGLWTYSPNSNIASIGTYILSRRNGWIEYKCRFSTNDLGLVSTNYHSEHEIDWLILGDSFTEGQGGCPWLTEEAIAQRTPGTIFLNGGLQGTGIQSFKLLLDWIDSQKSIRNIAVMAISNDFKRTPYAKLWDADLDCIRSHLNCTLQHGWWSIPSDATDKDILDMSFMRFDGRELLHDESMQRQLEYYSLTYRVYKKYMSSLGLNGNHDGFYPEIFDNNFRALEQIKDKYPKMKLILVTQKDEVGLLGVPNFDSEYLEAQLKIKNFEYSKCILSGSDFLKIDGHPNSVGYRKMRECLFDAIGSRLDSR